MPSSKATSSNPHGKPRNATAQGPSRDVPNARPPCSAEHRPNSFDARPQHAATHGLQQGGLGWPCGDSTARLPHVTFVKAFLEMNRLTIAGVLPSGGPLWVAIRSPVFTGTRIMNKTGNASMKSTHMFIALLHLKMIFPYLPIGNVNIYIYVCVCVLYVLYVIYIYICVCVCLIYVVIYVIYVIYVKYIHTIYNTLCFPWIMIHVGFTQCHHGFEPSVHRLPLGCGRAGQGVPSHQVRTQGPGSCQDSKTEITGDASLQQRSKLWHFELTVVYSHLFSDVIWNRSAMEPGEVTPVMHGEGDGQLQKRGGFVCLRCVFVCCMEASEKNL